MTFIFEPPRSLLVVAAVLVIAGLLVVFLTRRNPARKALGLIVALALAGVLLLRYQTAEVTVDEAGITADTYGEPTILWSDAEEAIYVADLRASRYAPKPGLKSSFRLLGYAKARYGWFDTFGEEPALFAVQRFDGDAVVVKTKTNTYVFGPGDARGLAQAIAAYLPVSGLDAAVVVGAVGPESVPLVRRHF
jgi:hypothetical protein